MAFVEDVVDELLPMFSEDDPADIVNRLDDVFQRKLAGLHPMQGHAVAFMAGMMIQGRRAHKQARQ